MIGHDTEGEDHRVASVSFVDRLDRELSQARFPEVRDAVPGSEPTMERGTGAVVGETSQALRSTGEHRWRTYTMRQRVRNSAHGDARTRRLGGRGRARGAGAPRQRFGSAPETARTACAPHRPCSTAMLERGGSSVEGRARGAGAPRRRFRERSPEKRARRARPTSSCSTAAMLERGGSAVVAGLVGLARRASVFGSAPGTARTACAPHKPCSTTMLEPGGSSVVAGLVGLARRASVFGSAPGNSAHGVRAPQALQHNDARTRRLVGQGRARGAGAPRQRLRERSGKARTACAPHKPCSTTETCARRARPAGPAARRERASAARRVECARRRPRCGGRSRSWPGAGAPGRGRGGIARRCPRSRRAAP